MSTTTVGARSDAIELLTSHHREVEQLWSRIQAAHERGAEVQQDEAQALIRLLSQHDAIETQLLYPELRKLGDQGREKSDHSLQEHQKVRDLLKEVDKGDVRDEATFRTLAECMQEVQHHVQEEESQIFPMLRDGCSPERLMDLGEKMATAMKTAPTHPHPMTPDSKAGATIAGAVSGVVDRAKDALRGGDR